MLTYLVAFTLAFVVAAALTPLLRALAPIIGGVDQGTSSRKVHTSPIPRIGGVAIVTAFYAPLVGLIVYENLISQLFLREPQRVVGLFAGGLVIALLGFYDDLRGANARVKFVVQFAVAGAMYALGHRIEVIANPFGAPVELGWLGLPLTLVWIVGIINAMNLIDGLDGLAAGVAAIAVALNFAVAFNRPDVLQCLFMAALAGGVIGFLLYNFNPATIFMGDSGSMFLGFVLAVTSVSSSQKSSAAVSILVPIVGLGLPIADTLLAMLRRALRGRPMFSADREHIHHRLLALGLTHRQAVLTLYAICIVLAGCAFVLTYASSVTITVTLAGLSFAAVALFRLLGYLKITPDVAATNARNRERNTNLRGLVRELGERLGQARTIDQVWDAVKVMVVSLDAQVATLVVVERQRGGEERSVVTTWRGDDAAAASPNVCAVKLELERRQSVSGRSRRLGSLEVVWRDGRREVERDDEISLEMLAAHLEVALEKLMADAAEPAARSNVIEMRRRPDPE